MNGFIRLSGLTDNDEAVNRLINALKGGAYLIATSTIAAGMLIVIQLSVLSSDKLFSIQGLGAGLAFISPSLHGVYLNRQAGKFLDR